MEARSGSRGRYHRQGVDHGAESLTKAQVFFFFYFFLNFYFFFYGKLTLLKKNKQ